MKIKNNIVAEFDEFSKDYTNDMIRCVPHYSTLVSSFVEELPPTFMAESILDLGCGNGNITDMVLRKFPHAQYTLLDASQEMINLCKVRFKNISINYSVSYFQDFEFKTNAYDYIVAGFSLHHCNSNDKKELFKKIHSSLRKGGMFSCSDLMINKKDLKHPELLKQWQSFVLNNYKNQEKWKWLMEHYNEFDNPDAFKDQEKWLKESGFKRIKVIAKDTYWIHYQAAKNQ